MQQLNGQGVEKFPKPLARLFPWLGALILVASCGKKESQAPNADPAATSAAAPTQTAAPVSSPATLVEAKAAMKARDYDKAAQLMIELQKPASPAMTPEQAAAVVNQIRALQGALGAAVAGGDPKAIAAAQALRAASAHR